MPAERYKVRVTRDHLVFRRGHFISYKGDRSERLHVHNDRAAVGVGGTPDGVNGYLIDSIALKARTRAITDDLDHRMLLATDGSLIDVEATAERVRVRDRDRGWAFPREDCVLLPVGNTTAELIARHIERLGRHTRSTARERDLAWPACHRCLGGGATAATARR
jgi:6-pyruvoyltetrahydropterin/6-carboxytetrahydropterin synthase